MRIRIAAILAALALALGIGFIPTTALAEPATQTTATATTTINEPVPSDPTKKPAPAVLSAAQQQELADAGFAETDVNVSFSADHGTWVKDSKGREVMTDAWITTRTFTNGDGVQVALDDNGLFHKNFNVLTRNWETVTVIPAGTFMLTDVVLAPKGGMDFWCGDNGKDWTVQDLVADAAQQRADVASGITDTFTPRLGSDDVQEVANPGGAWCFTAATKA